MKNKEELSSSFLEKNNVMNKGNVQTLFTDTARPWTLKLVGQT